MSKVLVLKLLLAATVLVVEVYGQRPTTSLRRTSNLMNAEIYPAYREYIRRIRRTRQRTAAGNIPGIFRQNKSNREGTFDPTTYSASESGVSKATTASHPTPSLDLPHSTAVASDMVRPQALTSNNDPLLFPGGQIPADPHQDPSHESEGLENKDVPVPHEEATNSGSLSNANRKTFRTYVTPSCAPDSNQPCERDRDYDQFIIAKMEDVLRRTQLNSVFDNDVVSHLINDTAIVKQKDILPQSILRRGSNLITETPACNAVESIIYPQRARTQAQDWVFVLNQNMVRQGVRVEKCLREGETCSLGAELPPTISTVCRQKFIYRKLLVLNSEGTDIQPESVLIPSCCVCYVRRSDDILVPRIRNFTTAGEGRTAPPDVDQAEPMGVPLNTNEPGPQSESGSLPQNDQTNRQINF